MWSKHSYVHTFIPDYIPLDSIHIIISVYPLLLPILGFHKMLWKALKFVVLIGTAMDFHDEEDRIQTIFLIANGGRKMPTVNFDCQSKVTVCCSVESSTGFNISQDHLWKNWLQPAIEQLWTHGNAQRSDTLSCNWCGEMAVSAWTWLETPDCEQVIMYSSPP